MSVATGNRSSSWMLRATAPIRLAGRHPWGFLGFLGLLILAGLWGWWATQLWGLPDVGDPFDVAALEAENNNVPDARNAFLEYQRAGSINAANRRKYQANKTAQDLNKTDGDWSKANATWKSYLADSGEALTVWRTGTDKPDFLYEHPEGLSFNTLLSVSQELRSLAWLAILEGSRLESQGDLAGAWGWHRAALRSSRHSGRHGFEIERLIGAAIHDAVSKRVIAWSDDPRVDAPLLRQALDDVIAIDRMTVPPSVALKMEYMIGIQSMSDPDVVRSILVEANGIDKPDWCQNLAISKENKERIQSIRVFAANDRERSRRLTRLMMANWLSQIDKPASKRTKLYRTEPPIYGPDPDSPAASRAISPEKLSEWLDSSMLAIRHFEFLKKFAIAIDRETDRRARLVYHLADQLYQREHEGNPPPTPSALVGPYLKFLPEGYDSPVPPPLF